MLRWLAERLRRIWMPAQIVPCNVGNYTVQDIEVAAKLVRLAAIQPSIELRAIEPHAQRSEVINNAITLLKLAALQQVDLVLLPERFPLRGVKLRHHQLWDWANEQGDELFQHLSQIARTYQMAIIAPINERWDGKLYNSAWVFNQQGEFIGRYCKIHCTRMEREAGITPGTEWTLFDLEIGRVGVLICHDMSFPESARCLMLQGARLIAWPHNQSGWGDIAWDAVLRTRAIDNAVFILGACCGLPMNRAWQPGMGVGLSGVIAPDGLWLTSMGRSVGVAVASVVIDTPRLVYDFTQPGVQDYRDIVQQERRVDTYQVLLQNKQNSF